MSLERLKNLSLEELRHLELCIQNALEEKTISRLDEAKQAVLALLTEQFPEIALSDLCEQLQADLPDQPSSEAPEDLSESEAAIPEPEEAPSPEVGDMTNLMRSLHAYTADLKEKREDVLAKEQARLLWLTHGGKQKMSCVYGDQLANILQEAINQLERITDESFNQSSEIIQAEVATISAWLEAYTGIPLVGGMLTVIAPPLLKLPSPEVATAASPQPPAPEPLTLGGIQMPLSRTRLN